MALPVLVAGAGPVGLTLACELDRLGVECRIADASPDRAVVSRATDLHAGSLEVWDRIGVAESVVTAVRPDGSVTSLHELLREPGLQVWACAGVGAPDAAMALAARFAPLVRARVLATGELPAAGPPGVEVLADAGLRAHGRLGATEETAFVVRPDGYLGFRCEPPDPARIAGHLGRLGVGAG